MGTSVTVSVEETTLPVEITEAPADEWQALGRELAEMAQVVGPKGQVSEEFYDRFIATMQSTMFDRGQYAGVPLPMGGYWLEVAPGYPYEGIAGYWPDDEAEGEESPNATCKVTTADLVEATGGTVLNEWFITRRGLRYHVVTYRDKHGRHRHKRALCRTYSSRRLTLDLNTLGASRAWDLDAEMRALETLKEMVTPIAWKYYVLTGGFLESSKRSGVMYWFRRCKPTLALSMRGPSGLGIKPLAALCLHPIAYYLPSHAGAMVPTDDVIAHLTMMRANEHTFWKRANQHAVEEAEAAV
jgi:hypothetical protein